MTILLSVIAFTLFSLVDTFSSYDHIRACTDSLIDSDTTCVSVNKSVQRGSGLLDSWWSTYGEKISEQDLEQLRKDTGLPLNGLFIPHDADLSFYSQFDENYEFTKGEYQTNLTHFCGFTEITQESMQQMKFKLVAGKLPDGKKDEIAVSAALCDTFVKAGYRAPAAEDAKKLPKLQKVGAPLEMVGKVIRLMGVDYTVSGVIDTGFDLSRYDRLLEDTEQNTTADNLINYIMISELRVATNYSYTGCAMVGPGRVQAMADEEPDIYEQNGNGDYSVSLETENGWGGWRFRIGADGRRLEFKGTRGTMLKVR